MASRIPDFNKTYQAAQQKALESFQQATKQNQEYQSENRSLSNDADENYENFHRPPRTPWYMYTLASKQKANKIGRSIYTFDECIAFYCNPSQYTLDLPFRQSVAKAKGGLVFHTFRDVHRNDTNLDFGTIQITFTSGSILPRKYKNSTNTGFPQGLSDYYTYLDIVQQDRVYRNENNEIEPNYIVIELNTVAFPKLTMYTFPLDKVGHGENVDTVGELSDWNGNFQIFNTEPSIFNGNGGLHEILEAEWRKNS